MQETSIDALAENIASRLSNLPDNGGVIDSQSSLQAGIAFVSWEGVHNFHSKRIMRHVITSPSNRLCSTK